MADIAKWAVLIAGFIALVAIILTLPFAEFIDMTEFENGILTIVSNCGLALYDVRAFINLFLTSVGRKILSGIMIYLFLSWAYKLGVKITAWAFHWIFK